MPSGWGTPHPGVGACRRHLGNTATHGTHAERVLAERADEQALAELRKLGVTPEPIGSPLDALAELAAEAVQWKAILRGRVSELSALDATAPDGVARIKPVVSMYERALDRTGVLCGSLAKLGIDERTFVMISQEKALMLNAAVKAILHRCGVDLDPVVREICAQEMRRVREQRKRLML